MLEDRSIQNASEAELLSLARQPGGRRAYGELVRRHQVWLVRLLGYILQDRAAAQDVAQDAFLRAYLALERCPDNTNFRAWLRVIATRLAYNVRRDSKRRQEKLEQAGLTEDSSDSSMQRAENVDWVLQLLGALSHGDREILVLRYVEELSIKEVATTLSIGESAAKMRLTRAKAELLKRHDRSTTA